MGTRRWLALVAVFGAACSQSLTLPPLARPEHHAFLPKAEAPPPPKVGFPSNRLTVVPAGTFGPYVGDRPEGMLTAWAADLNGKRRWLTAPIRRTPSEEPKIVADAAPDIDLVALRPLGGTSQGFVLLSSAREFSGERVDAMALGLRGELAGGPTPLAQSLPEVVWVDAVPTATGAIAMWAVRRDDRADLYGVELGTSGDLRDQPSVLVPDVRAWQVAAFGQGAAIAALTAGKTRDAPGTIRVSFVDSEGHADKKSLTVADGATAEPDLDLAALGDKLEVAWSDRKDGEARLYGAVVDASGNLTKPASELGLPFGAQSLVKIVPPEHPGGPAFLAWENAVEQGDAVRAIRVAPLSASGTLGDASGIVQMSATDGVPELVATPAGLAGLTLAPACRVSESCGGRRPVPTFVGFDSTLNVVVSAPVRVDELDGQPADLAWGLTCHGSNCTALAAGPGSPAPVFSVELSEVPPEWTPSAWNVANGPAPRATWMNSIARSDSIAELSAVRQGATSRVAWVTYFDPETPFLRSKTAAPDGKYEPPRAVVRVLDLPDKGVPAETTVISYRAHSPGGVAIAPGDPTSGQSLIAWAGIDNKVPQVFLTLVGPNGKKVAQKMLTHGKNGVSGVTLASVGNAWVVAWIEERPNASDVHIAKVDDKLKPIVTERRLGNDAGSATGVQLLERGDHVFAVWADARGPNVGVADIFAARLSSADLASVGPEHPVAETPTHSRSPALAAFGDGAVVGWVEEPPSNSSQSDASLMFAQLDSGAETVSGSVTRVTLSGSAEGLGISCGNDVCRFAASVATSDAGGIEAFEWAPNRDVVPRHLVGLAAMPRDAAAPVILGDGIFYADEARPGDARLRHLGVTWK